MDGRYQEGCVSSQADPVTITPSRTALLLLDFQQMVVGQIPDSGPLIERVVALRDAARQAGLLTIYVHVAFRPGYPEVSGHNPMFRGVKEYGLMQRDSADSDFHPRLTPDKNEVTITKTRVGAFRATPLDQILRAHGAEVLLIAGVNTSGTVLSTTRDAADRDYELIVVGDCCADPDESLHRVLIGQVLPMQATIVESAAVAAAVAG
jgi:nicotinamidase-related amidase